LWVYGLMGGWKKSVLLCLCTFFFCRCRVQYYWRSFFWIRQDSLWHCAFYAPKLNAYIKTHKEGQPIRPVINSMQTPLYKTAKFLNRKLHNLIRLPNTFIHSVFCLTTGPKPPPKGCSTYCDPEPPPSNENIIFCP